jgi:hypothetical protein
MTLWKNIVKKSPANELEKHTFRDVMSLECSSGKIHYNIEYFYFKFILKFAKNVLQK